MFALPTAMPRFKSIIFYQIALKFTYFCKKMQNFRSLGAPPPDPQSSSLTANFWQRLISGKCVDVDADCYV